MMKIRKMGNGAGEYVWYCTIYHKWKPVATGNGLTKESAIREAQQSYNTWKQERGHE
ncbi:MAG: hypothetical protein GY696_29160 [Gammaproteobacteria bacterium]|nr:hypothetical protein [Gammaproteobacteria bacterium]